MSGSRALRWPWLASLLIQSGGARADVSFAIVSEGPGFLDPTPAAPVGDNPGTTLGEQRKIAVARALALFGKELDSSVPLLVFVTFSALGCGRDSAVLGQAYAGSYVRGGFSADSSPERLYPIALADRLAGRDLSPGEPDVVIELNSSLDEPRCAATLRGWYYGLDGNAGGRQDLMQVVLHEFAHGLGFSSFVDLETGESELPDGIDVFSARVRDLDRDRTWAELTPDERARSAVNVRRVVFDGPETSSASLAVLGRGAPSLTLEPPVPGFSGWVSDVAFALNPSLAPVSGPLVLSQPVNPCGVPRSDLRGAIALLEPRCTFSDVAAQLKRAGALGALMIVPSRPGLPAQPLGDYGVQVALPVLTISQLEAAQLASALASHPIRATLGGDPALPLGADARGRPFVYATRPAAPGSSISHFDTLARPDLLMEPFISDAHPHQLDLTLAVLHDLGWRTFCGNGRPDPGEQCDDGAANSDALSDRCRTTCQLPRCGDGLVDRGEVCDLGARNSDLTPDTCRTSCQLAHCGDHVIDSGEACDGAPSCSPSCSAIAAIEGPAPGTAAGPDLTPTRAERHDGCGIASSRSDAASASWLALVALALTRRRARMR